MKRSVTASGTARTDSQADVRYEREADIAADGPSESSIAKKPD